MDAGLLHGDVHRYLSVAVNDLVTVDDDKIFPKRDQFEEHLSKDIGGFQHIYAFSSHIDKLEVIGDFARAEVTSTFDGTKSDKKDPQGFVRTENKRDRVQNIFMYPTRIPYQKCGLSGIHWFDILRRSMVDQIQSFDRWKSVVLNNYKPTYHY